MRFTKSLWEAIRRPISTEKADLLAQRWLELPEALKTRQQVVGRHFSHCGYTLGPSFCSFGCTHCYLPTNANQAPMPSLEEMKTQVDANRRLLGDAGALQITGGDVVDAYFRAGRADELIEVVRYATDAGLVPMLMTHGQRLIENPDYLERLITEGRLRKLSIHVDMTQAGRPGFPIHQLTSEADLHPLREQIVDFIHRARSSTGVRLSAAQTVTVTARNIDSIGEIMRWTLAEKRRLDALGMISFQPEANVGRTRFSENPVSPDKSWRKICQSIGMELKKDHLWLGHPDCSHWITLAVFFPEGKVVNLFAGDEESRVFWDDVLATWGGVGSRGADNWLANLQRLSLLARRPTVAAAGWRFARHLLSQQNLSLPRALSLLLRRQVATLNVIQHNFMSAEEIRSGSSTVRERLQGCSFRGAVRKGEEWEAVPMCAMNVDQRQEIYAQEILKDKP